MTQSYKYFILIYHIVVKLYQHGNEKLQKMFDFYWYTLEKYKKKAGKMGTHGMQYIPCSYQFKHAKHKKHVHIHI